MTADVAWLTDYEREILGLASRRRAMVHRIQADARTARDKARINQPLNKEPSKEDAHLINERRRTAESEQALLNDAVLNHSGLGQIRKIPGTPFAHRQWGFLLLGQDLLENPGTGIGVTQDASKTGAFISGTDGPHMELREHEYGVTHLFGCQYSTQWCDESRPTLKYAIFPRTYVSGWVSASVADSFFANPDNSAVAFLLISTVTVFQIRAGTRPIVKIAETPEETLGELSWEKEGGVAFFDYAYGYLHDVPSFQLEADPQGRVLPANVFCGIETKLRIMQWDWNGPTAASCGLYDQNRMPIPDDRGRVEIWAEDFPIWAPSRDFG